METVELVKRAIRDNLLLEPLESLVDSDPHSSHDVEKSASVLAPFAIAFESQDHSKMWVVGRLQTKVHEMRKAGNVSVYWLHSLMHSFPIETFRGAKLLQNPIKPAEPTSESELQEIASLGLELIE